MNLAFKDVQHNLGRFSLTAIGIGMMLMIVMGMAGIYRGLIEDATLVIDRIGSDLWIVLFNTFQTTVDKLRARGPFRRIRQPGEREHSNSDAREHRQ